jgi:hypothetical protein
MNLLDLLNDAGGQQSLGALARQLGLDSSKTSDLVSAVAPALLQGLQKQTMSREGLSNFKSALERGNHQQYLDNPDLLSKAETVLDGNGILGHLFGSKDVSRKVAAQASSATGIDTSLIKQALPLLAGLAMGAVSKSKTSGSASEDSISQLISGLAKDGLGVDDVMGFAKKFF